ncbi:hypothetical protein Tco_0347917 [Tanacetum coccineum]
MASQDAILSKFEADFKQQQSEMTNKIGVVLKAITDQIMGALPCDTVKNLKLNVDSTSPVLSARFYPTKDPQCSTQINGSINAITVCPKRSGESQNNKPEKDDPENINTNHSSPPDPSVSFLIKKNDDSHMEEPDVGENAEAREIGIEYFDIFPTRSELAYHKRRKLDPMEDPNRGVSNFTGRIKGMHIFVGNFTYVLDFMIVEDISSIIDPRLSQVVLGRPFIDVSNMTHDLSSGVHTKSVYLRNKKNKRRGVDYVKSKILGFYKERLELGPEYVTGLEDEGEVAIKSLLNAVSITSALIDVNVAQSKLVMLENFNENYSKCLRLLYRVNAAEGVNAANEEVSTTELVSTAYMIDYALWEVIENGATLPKTQVVEGVTTLMPITSAKDKAQRRLEVKARTNKKTQRNLFKQQYENFNAPSSEMLDQTFNRLQKLASQLELLDEKLSQEDVYELEVKGMSSSSSSTQNMVFVSSSNNNTSSSNEAVNAAHGVTTASTQVNAANSTNIDNLSDAVICSFFASEPNSP